MFSLFLEDWSYLGIVLVLMLSGCGFPIPEEIPIVLAGVFSSEEVGTLNPWLAYVSCLIGAVIGDTIMYGIGYRWGHRLLKDYPRFAKFLHAEREARFEQAIQVHGLKVLFFARFMIGVRGPVYLAAGILRMSFRRFILVDMVAATLVVSLFFGLSYTYGREIAQFIRNWQITLTGVAAVVVTGLATYWLMRRRKRRLEKLAKITEFRARRTRERIEQASEDAAEGDPRSADSSSDNADAESNGYHSDSEEAPDVSSRKNSA